MTQAVWNVRDFGAAGDGRNKDTTGIQAAVDSCASTGGGRVLVPAGLYVTGTLYLRSHVELHLAAGARLLGSPDKEDYNADDAFPEDPPTTSENASAAHLVIAYRVDDVSITGQGVIDGNSSAFFGPDDPSLTPQGYRFKRGNRPIAGWRTGQSVFFFGCTRAAIRDVSLVNAPYWTVYLYACADVQVRGVTITNPPSTQNGDGLDIVSCRSVTVSDCIIRSGDDSLVLRTRAVDDPTLPVSGPVCEDVTVSNCVLSTPCNAIRIGVSNGTVRRCTLSNIVITQTRTAINMISRYSERNPHGTCIQDVHFADFIVDSCLPFAISVGPGATRPAAIRDVSFSRFHITATAGAQLIGSTDVPIERVRFADIDWTLTGGTDNLELVDNLPEQPAIPGYHGAGGAPALPYALYGRHLIDSEFDRIRFRWHDPSPVWRDALHLRDSNGVDSHRVTQLGTPTRNPR